MCTVETFRYLQSEVTEWRRYLHRNPELRYELHNIARFVVEKLASFGTNTSNPTSLKPASLL